MPSTPPPSSLTTQATHPLGSTAPRLFPPTLLACQGQQGGLLQHRLLLAQAVSTLGHFSEDIPATWNALGKGAQRGKFIGPSADLSTPFGIVQGRVAGGIGQAVL